MQTPFSMPASRTRAEGLALIAVISLLGALAVLQHRWLGAIAEAERRELVEEAGEKAVAIAQDVDRELTRAFLELRLDARALEAKGGSDFAERLKRWRAESSHPGLVSAIYVADRPLKGPVRLRRFDPSPGRFVETVWPDSLRRVKEVLDPGSGEASSPAMGASLPPVMAEVPALIGPVLTILVDTKAPRVDGPPGMRQVREMFMAHEAPGPIEIIELDPRYLREGLVAALAASRLGPSGPFDWSVISAADGSTVAGAVWAPEAKPDATSPLLRLRFDDLETSLLRGVLPGLSRVVAESSVRVLVQASAPGGGARLDRSSTGAAPWTLALRHQAGSIEAAVRGQQRRNTALSASILGVLGLSAGLVFFSARRLRALATRQVEFVASVSHELRTPLAVIRSAADNLADGVVHEPSQARRYGALIRDESVRLSDMVEHVLEFAGADSPARSARGPIDVAEAARSAVKGLEPLAIERGARVTLECAGEPLRVNGDMSHLTRAISNLLGNALKYGGSVPEVTLQVLRASDEVRITVADRGAGLSADELPKLFEPSYRGPRASEAQIPGSGLGLALVRRIVSSHGGRVSAGNQPRGGAVFMISLPAA